MCERLAINCAKTVRPLFIHHCFPTAPMGAPKTPNPIFSDFPLDFAQIVFYEIGANPLVPLDLVESAKCFTGHQCFNIIARPVPRGPTPDQNRQAVPETALRFLPPAFYQRNAAPPGQSLVLWSRRDNDGSRRPHRMERRLVAEYAAIPARVVRDTRKRLLWQPYFRQGVVIDRGPLAPCLGIVR